MTPDSRWLDSRGGRRVRKPTVPPPRPQSEIDDTVPIEPPSVSRRIIMARSGKRPWVAPVLPRRKPLFHDWRRLLDLSQSIVIALFVNALVIYLLSIVASQYGKRLPPPRLEVTVSPSEKDSQTEASSSASMARKFSQKTSETQNPEKTVQEAYRAVALSSLSLPVEGLPSLGKDFSSGLEDFGLGTALGKAGSMRGIGVGQLGTIFEGHGLGDGADMLIYVDNSRSMWRHGRLVTDLVSRLFPYARITYIEGCAIVPNSGLVGVLSGEWAPRSKVYFVCDLRDSVTYEGLEALRLALIKGKPNRELHIVSFGNSPPLELLLLLKETFGSVTVVRDR